MKRCVMTSELGLTSECTAYAVHVVTYEFAVVEYRADFGNSIFGIGRVGHGAGSLALILCHVYRSIC